MVYFPIAITLSPLGTYAYVTNGGNLFYGFAVGPTGSFTGAYFDYFLGSTLGVGSIDPSTQYWFVVDSAGSRVDGQGIAITGLGYGLGSYPTGNVPSAVLAEPSGRFVYVANSADSTISAYSLANATGVLTPITGTFSTGSGPDSLAASNDGKYLYAVNNGSGTVSIFTINNDGTLTATGSATTATGPTSIATVGTYK
jgi:DNA-binding beta-propeller fold protein YncE